MTIRARLFDRDVAATGVPAALEVHDDWIEVRTGDRVLRSAIADLQIREVGFGRELGFELAWRSDDDMHAVHVIEPDSVRALRALPQIAAAPQMLQWLQSTRRRSIGRAIGWIAVATIVLLPLLLVLLFVAQADRIAGLLVASVPIDTEVQLGRAAFESMRAALSLQDTGAQYEAVREIGLQLSQGSSYPYEFHVADDESINAFALPGGIIVVHEGLIAATRRPEELAGVLAHEIQHVEQRHSLKGLFKELGLRGVWMLVTGDIGGTIAGQAALELTSRKFSRSDESNADAMAFDTLIGAGIDPSGMVDFFTTMARENRAKLPELLSTHPADEAREKALQERVEQLKQRSFQPLMLGAWPPGEN